MKTIFTWLSAVLITAAIISPFFWLHFLKKKSGWLYISISSIIFLIIYYLYIFKLSDLILDVFAKISADSYYFYYDAETISMPITPLLMVISPFIFTKILYGKFSLKSIIISIFSSIVIFVALVFTFVYYIFPKGFEVLLKNI